MFYSRSTIVISAMAELTTELLNRMRDIDGFPIGEDEDIIALSDPPKYTACPNSFIEEFIKEHGKPYNPETDDYHREPFASDISEGKHDPIYNVHSYHTKVPHKAIMRYILHYTEPGDLVFDGFSGTGMTSVAAQLCGDKSTVESLEYKVETDGTIYQQNVDENDNIVWNQFSKLGVRRAIMNDLSPSATFISSCTVNTNDLDNDISKIRDLLTQIKDENKEFRITKHSGWKAKLSSYDTRNNVIRNKQQGKINYIIWSDVISCPECGKKWNYWESPAIDISSKVPNKVFNCDSCNVKIKKGKFTIIKEAWYDPVQNKVIQIQRKKPVLINYSVGSSRYEKWPDDEDLLLIEKNDNELSKYIPFSCELPEGYNTAQPKGSHGYTHTHHFFSSRTLFFLSKLLHFAKQNRTLLFTISAAMQKLTLRNRYMPWYGGRALEDFD